MESPQSSVTDIQVSCAPLQGNLKELTKMCSTGNRAHTCSSILSQAPSIYTQNGKPSNYSAPPRLFTQEDHSFLRCPHPTPQVRQCLRQHQPSTRQQWGWQCPQTLSDFGILFPTNPQITSAPEGTWTYWLACLSIPSLKNLSVDYCLIPLNTQTVLYTHLHIFKGI